MLAALKIMAKTSNINFVRFQFLTAVGCGMGCNTVRYKLGDVSEKRDASSSMNLVTNSPESSENFYIYKAAHPTGIPQY
jgi:hypothetical protein